MDEHNDEYLAHYGVLGMKWGVRKNPQKAYTKATKKYNRLKRKADKAQIKAQKATAHTPSRLMRITDIGRSIYDYKVRRINAKNASAAKAQIKADKWLTSMKKEFSKVPVSALPDADLSWLN